MLIARLNFQVIREVQPTMSFSLSHLDGKVRQEASYKAKNLKCFEIHYKGTGRIALQLLSSGLEMSKELSLSDMHVSYKRGNIIFQVLTTLNEDEVMNYVDKKAQFYNIYHMVDRKRRNSSLWLTNKIQINHGFDSSTKLQRFVSALAKNNYVAKNLVLN